MSRRCFLIGLLLLIGSPVPVLYAVGMGGMGGVGGMVDKLSIQTKSVGPVVFSHSRHAFKCDVCHPNLFQKKNNSNHTTMELMEKGRSCGACHNGRQAFSVTGDCVTCHAGDIAIKTKQVGNVMFSHEVHIGMFGCEECHPDLFKPRNNSNHATMQAMADGASCGACHDGDAAFGVTGDCATCHAGDILYKDEGRRKCGFPARGSHRHVRLR